ncbi:Rv3235 family protein [Nesterenkonia cremea]|uniref:Uncharacterized protein n=1 Tax=Nesterenkonia cremea TaxID=1882340 RepID=A0A917ARB3_9MICC|nr:Rv3235 family protein [Nesterenkonia cremea]GGE64601.1 hypothetical protein GCM10011401_09650 [Nesterenkonia cremea]
MTVTTPAPLVRSRTTFRLQREEELTSDLRSSTPTEVIAVSSAEGDGQRPSALATSAEEERQINAISRIICQATMEALAGLRPVVQLKRWLEAEVYAKVRQRVELTHDVQQLAPKAPRPLAFHQLRTEKVAQGVWECAVVFGDEHRVRACALRLEAHRRRWRVVALELG